MRQVSGPSEVQVFQGIYYSFNANSKQNIELPSSEPLEI